MHAYRHAPDLVEAPQDQLELAYVTPQSRCPNRRALQPQIEVHVPDPINNVCVLASLFVRLRSHAQVYERQVTTILARHTRSNLLSRIAHQDAQIPGLWNFA